MSQSIDVTLNGVDNLSSVLRNASAAGTAMGNLVSGAMGLIASSVGTAVEGVKGLISSASAVQTDLIAASGSMQALMGGSYKDASLYAEKLNNSFVKMGSTLPGVTEDYASIGRTISDDVGAAFKGLTGQLDKPAFEKALLSMSQGVGILAQSAGESATGAGQAIARVMNGDKAAFKLLFFDKNPIVKNQVEQFLKAEGKTLEDWTTMTTRDRIGILNKALDKAASPEMIAALTATAAGKYAEWETMLTDPTTGLLGFMRKVESRGGKTALDALYGLMEKTEGAFQAIADKFPFKVDVMAGVIDALTSVGTLMDGIKNVFSAKDLGAVAANIQSSMSGLFSSFSSLDTTAIGTSLATGLTDLLSKASQGIATMFQGIDLGSVFTKLASANTSIVEGISAFTMKLAESLATGVNTSATAITQAATGADWASIGKSASNAFAAAITGLVGTVASFLSRVDWSSVLTALSALIEGFRAAVRSAVMNLGLAMASAVTNGLATLASSVAQYIQSAFTASMPSMPSPVAVPTPTPTPTATATPTPTATPPATGTPPAAGTPRATVPVAGGSASASAATIAAETRALQAAAAGRSAATGSLQPLFAAVSDEQRISGGRAVLANTRNYLEPQTD